jgi:hypothetical protein
MAACTYTPVLMKCLLVDEKKKNGGYAVSSSNGWELRALFVRTVGENSVFPSSNHKRASGMIT